MAYTLQPKSEAFVSGKNILASEHLQFIEGGATIEAGQGFLPIGTAIAKRADGLFEAFKADGVYSDYGILNVDVDASEANAVVGEVIIRGSVYAGKLEANVTDAFKALTPLIRYV